jgi:hypothetical protein
VVLGVWICKNEISLFIKIRCYIFLIRLLWRLNLQEKLPEKIAILAFPNPNPIQIQIWIHKTDLQKKTYEEIFQFCRTGYSCKLGANDFSGAVLETIRIAILEKSINLDTHTR